MPHAGKRLEEWRKSLQGAVTASAAARAQVEWEDSRWWRLERVESWSPAQQADVSSSARSKNFRFWY